VVTRSGTALVPEKKFSERRAFLMHAGVLRSGWMPIKNVKNVVNTI